MEYQSYFALILYQKAAPLERLLSYIWLRIIKELQSLNKLSNFSLQTINLVSEFTWNHQIISRARFNWLQARELWGQLNKDSTLTERRNSLFIDPSNRHHGK